MREISRIRTSKRTTHAAARRGSVSASMLVGLAIGTLDPISTASGQQIGRVSVEVRSSAPLTPITALGRWQMGYELHLTNFGSSAVELVQVDALDEADKVVGSWGGPALAQRILCLGTQASPMSAPQNPLERLSHKDGERLVAFMWLTGSISTMTPQKIHHRIIYRSKAQIDTITTNPRDLDRSLVGLQAPPVNGGPWVAIRGPSNTSGHRLSHVAVDGLVGIPQRYAVDWAALGPDGRLFKGDSTRVENWYGYGAPVRSVAVGKVVYVRADASEHAPMVRDVPLTLSAEDSMGNAVIVDVGTGRFATYAHLKPGSVRVRVGDAVAVGQELGAIGNSGNSLGPHLHFHVSNSPKPLGGEGIGFHIDEFELVGRVPSSAILVNGGSWVPNAAQPARTVRAESPLENMVVRFGPEPVRR
ncbi:MAG: M23 family metallopeptidase [Gemmatimonas sp.]